MAAALPNLTSDLDQAERDLAQHDICFVSGVLSGEQLEDAHRALYRAARHDAERGVRKGGFALDYGEGNHRVWNVLSRDPVFVDLVQHPAAMRMVRATIGWPALLGNLSANIATPGSAGGLLHADQIFVTEPWPPHQPQGVNVAWCLDAFTDTNGATRFVPGSHHLNRSDCKIAIGVWERSSARTEQARSRSGDRSYAWKIAIRRSLSRTLDRPCRSDFPIAIGRSLTTQRSASRSSFPPGRIIRT